MAEPIQGSTSTGGTPKSAPVVVGGVDSQGKVRPILVSSLGVMQVAG